MQPEPPNIVYPMQLNYSFFRKIKCLKTRTDKNLTFLFQNNFFLDLEHYDQHILKQILKAIYQTKHLKKKTTPIPLF